MIAVAGLAVLLIALVAVIVVSSGGDDDNATDDAADEVFLEPIDHVEDPFTPSVGDGAAAVATTTAPSTTSPATSSTAAKAGISSQPGGVPGLYGGTRNQATCDKEQLIAFLEENTDKGKAWADTLGIDQADIRTYVDGLTSVLLRTDTRVTNHGYKNGRATSIQVVLQAGTAVLVDDYGRPVTKCACGNPLTAPVPSKATYTGTRWRGFEPTNVTIVVENTVVINTFVLIDNDTGDAFERPTATDGTDDVDYDPGDVPPPDEPSTTTTEAPPPADNDLLSGSYTYSAVGSSAECTPAEGTLTVVVSGEGAGRTVTMTGDGGSSVSGTVADDLSFSTTGSGTGAATGETFEGRFVIEGTTVSLEGTDTVSGSVSCTFQVSGVKQ